MSSTQRLSGFASVPTLLSYSGQVTARAESKSEAWATHHLRACMAPDRNGFERAVVAGCEAIWSAVRAMTVDGEVVHDYVLTPGVTSMIVGVRILLDGDCGRLDCGTVSHWLDVVEELLTKEMP